MCNDYEQHVAWAEYQAMMNCLELGLSVVQSETDLPQHDDIRVNDLGPVIVRSGNGVALASMRFGLPPPRPKAAPVSTSARRVAALEKAIAA